MNTPAALLRFRQQRGFSIIEAMLATAILLALFLAWGSAMIVATDGENKAANHTEAVADANQILETVRRDPGFWSLTSNGGEFAGGDCSHCWSTYNDTFGVSTPRACSSQVPGASPACMFNWLAIADPGSVSNGAPTLAHIAVEVYYLGDNHQTEHYIVMGLSRQS